MDEIENPTLGTVLLQLAYVRAEHGKIDRRAQAATERAEEERLGDQLSALDQDIAKLEGAARGLIATQTGVPWHLIQEANL